MENQVIIKGEIEKIVETDKGAQIVLAAARDVDLNALAAIIAREATITFEPLPNLIDESEATAAPGAQTGKSDPTPSAPPAEPVAARPRPGHRPKPAPPAQEAADA